MLTRRRTHLEVGLVEILAAVPHQADESVQPVALQGPAHDAPAAWIVPVTAQPLLDRSLDAPRGFCPHPEHPLQVQVVHSATTLKRKEPRSTQLFQE